MTILWFVRIYRTMCSIDRLSDIYSRSKDAVLSLRTIVLNYLDSFQTWKKYFYVDDSMDRKIQKNENKQ